MGEVIQMSDYLERKVAPDETDIRKRIADIAIEQMLLSSERIRLEGLLNNPPEIS